MSFDKKLASTSFNDAKSGKHFSVIMKNKIQRNRIHNKAIGEKTKKDLRDHAIEVAKYHYEGLVNKKIVGFNWPKTKKQEERENKNRIKETENWLNRAKILVGGKV